MGRLIFVIEQKVLLIFFFISSTCAPKNKSKRRALFSECGGAYERLLWYGWVWCWKIFFLNHSILTTKTFRLRMELLFPEGGNGDVTSDDRWNWDLARDQSTSSVTKRANGHWHAIIASSCRWSQHEYKRQRVHRINSYFRWGAEPVTQQLSSGTASVAMGYYFAQLCASASVPSVASGWK